MHVAFVLLPEAVLPDPAVIAELHAELFPQAPPLQVDLAQDEPGTAGLRGPDGLAHLVLNDEPVADGEAERAAAHSLAAVGQDPELAAHAAHLVVVWSPSDALTLVEGLTAGSRLLAAVVLASGAGGVYVPAASTTHPPEWFVEVARVVDLPIMLWTGLSHGFGEDDRHSFLSYGMHQFGLTDILLSAPADDGADALEFLFELMLRGALAGALSIGGETLGPHPGQRLPVRVRPNPVDPDADVLCLDL